ncbi:hypothetical protein CDAR_167731 [Caerostris darwini]|uniref:Uncharacterized protein n=1 Tax=Caerostris darwini TaxID=1538125 RepID=A0AAV4M739_9ARAC|nr:hypothetical protein CDAR_167731 [Caerostris darwini]
MPSSKLSHRNSLPPLGARKMGSSEGSQKETTRPASPHVELMECTWHAFVVVVRVPGTRITITGHHQN